MSQRNTDIGGVYLLVQTVVKHFALENVLQQKQVSSEIISGISLPVWFLLLLFASVWLLVNTPQGCLQQAQTYWTSSESILLLPAHNTHFYFINKKYQIKKIFI